MVVNGDQFTAEDLARAEEANAATDRVLSAMRAFPDSYGGIRLTEKASQVEVFLTRSDAKAESAARKEGPQVHITVRPGTGTAAELAKIHDSIRESLPDLEASGIGPNYFGPDGVTGEEILQVESATPEQIAELERRFGPHLRVQIGTTDGDLLVDRGNDSAPWNGGSFITNGNANCTAGIPGHNAANQKFLITAAHCFAATNTVYQGNVTIPLGTFPTMGTVVSRDLRQGGYDAEVFSANSSDLTFSGSTTSSARAEFDGAATAQNGSYVCHSGAPEGQHCTYVYGNPGACRQFPYPLPPNNLRWLCGLTYTWSTSAQTVGLKRPGSGDCSFS